MERLLRKKYIDPSTFSTTELRRCLTKFDLTALGVGSTLGVGIYVLAGDIARDLAGPGVVLSFFIAAVASLLAALCYAEFASRVPRVGSAYVFSYVVVGELAAFIIGWNLILEYIIALSTGARAVSSYFEILASDYTRKNLTLPSSNASEPYRPDIIAALVVLLVTIPIAIGVKFTSWANNIMTVINILVVLIAVGVGFSLAEVGNWTSDFVPFGFSGVLAGAASAFFGFVGFDTVVTTAEEAEEPQKSIPVAILVSLGQYGVILCLLFNAVVVVVLRATQVKC